MKMKLLISLLILLTLTPLVLALDQVDSEIVLPYGENGTLAIPMFSRTYVRAYEGSQINFNIVDPDTNAIVIRNSLIIKEVQTTYSNILLSSEGSEYKEVTLNLGEDYQINYTSERQIPFMILKEIVSHYNATDPTDRNMVLYFNEPFMKSGKGKPDNTRIDTTAVNATSVEGSNTQNALNSLNIILIVLVIILIVIIAYFILNKKSKKLKPH